MQNTEFSQNETFMGCEATGFTAMSWFFLTFCLGTFYLLYLLFVVLNPAGPFTSPDDELSLLVVIGWAIGFLGTALPFLLIGGLCNVLIASLISFTIGRIRVIQGLVRLIFAVINGGIAWIAVSSAANAFNSKILYGDLQPMLFPSWLTLLATLSMAIAASIYSSMYHLSTSNQNDS